MIIVVLFSFGHGCSGDQPSEGDAHRHHSLPHHHLPRLLRSQRRRHSHPPLLPSGLQSLDWLTLNLHLKDANAPIPYIFEYVGWDWAKWIVMIGAYFGNYTALLLPVLDVELLVRPDGQPAGRDRAAAEGDLGHGQRRSPLQLPIKGPLAGPSVLYDFHCNLPPGPPKVPDALHGHPCLGLHIR